MCLYKAQRHLQEPRVEQNLPHWNFEQFPFCGPSSNSYKLGKHLSKIYNITTTFKANADMGEKTTYDALGQAVSDMKIEDDGTADRKILIAVDFGTTFSGVAWAQTRRVWATHCTGVALGLLTYSTA